MLVVYRYDLRGGIKIACDVDISTRQAMDQEIPLPRYYQIVHQLEKFIKESNCVPGERLPSEKELQSNFGVSRVTARRALGELEKRGLVTRQRGKGTYVAVRLEGFDLPKFTGSIADLFMIKKGWVVKDASIEEVRAPPKIKEALRLTGSSLSVVKIQRVLLLHGRPYGFHQNFYPCSIGKRISRDDLRKYLLLEILENKLHISVSKLIQVLGATLADTEIADKLQISFGSPILYVERTVLGEKGIPVGFTQAYYRGDIYCLSVTLARTDVHSSKAWGSPN